MGRLKPLPFREVKRRLEAAGFAEISQKGSHVKFVRRLGETVDTAVVPNEREIPVGTLRSIFQQAHIDPEQNGTRWPDRTFRCNKRMETRQPSRAAVAARMGPLTG